MTKTSTKKKMKRTPVMIVLAIIATMLYLKFLYMALMMLTDIMGGLLVASLIAFVGYKLIRKFLFK